MTAFILGIRTPLSRTWVPASLRMSSKADDQTLRRIAHQLEEEPSADHEEAGQRAVPAVAPDNSPALPTGPGADGPVVSAEQGTSTALVREDPRAGVAPRGQRPAGGGAAGGGACRSGFPTVLSAVAGTGR